MEVLVTFLEGDPDQPLISGCLYHNTGTMKKVAEPARDVTSLTVVNSYQISVGAHTLGQGHHMPGHPSRASSARL
jgi:uncharacterized protein involved in type VI secretion and phage assembly